MLVAGALIGFLTLLLLVSSCVLCLSLQVATEVSLLASPQRPEEGPFFFFAKLKGFIGCSRVQKVGITKGTLLKTSKG